MIKEQVTETTNAIITLDSIRKDIIEASKQLSSLYSEKKLVLEVIEKRENELRQKETAIQEAETIMKDRSTQLSDQEKKAQGAVVRSNEELDVLKKQKSDAMTELSRINDWIFSGEREKALLNIEIESLQKISVTKKQYIKDIEEYSIKRDSLLKENADALAEKRNISEKSEQKLLEVQKKVEDAVQELLKVEDSLERAKSELNNAVTEKMRIHKDLEVYISRVEKKYKKAFPELKMKL